MTAFYTPEEEKTLRLRARRCLRAALALLGAATAACVTLCFFVRTGNEARMYLTVVSVFTLLGWAALLLLVLGWRPLRAEHRHIAGILAGEEETFCGELGAPGPETRIPGSICVRRVTLRSGEERVQLIVRARLARQLPPAGARVRVRAVKRYITACEVDDEKD